MTTKYIIGTVTEELTKAEKEFLHHFANFLLYRRKVAKNIRQFPGDLHLLELTDFGTWTFIKKYNSKNEPVDLYYIIGKLINNISTSQKVYGSFLYNYRHYCRYNSFIGFYIYTNSKNKEINSGSPMEHTTIGN